MVRVGITEVARLAGVSLMTVSRVLNDSPNVRDATRRKVLAACARLKYRRNLAASGVRSRRSRVIGVILPTLVHSFFARIVNGIEARCREDGYHVMILQGSAERSPCALTWEDVESLLARQVDGLVIAAELRGSIVRRLRQETVPVVFLDSPAPGGGFPFVGTADFDGARILAEHLLDFGHHQILIVAGPKRGYGSNLRLAGCRAALEQRGIKLDRRLVLHTDFLTAGGYRAVLEFTRRHGRCFTAVFGANDYLAVGAMAALAQSGLKAPDDVSVVGFTGDEIGAFTVPPLTTMVQPAEAMGAKAVEIILGRIKGDVRPGAPAQFLLPARFLSRGSVGRARGCV